MWRKKDIWKMPRIPRAGFHIQLRRSQLDLAKSSFANRRPFSRTRTRWPFWASRSAETLPPNPEPMMIQS